MPVLEERVVLAATIEDIITGAADQDVLPFATGQRVVIVASIARPGLVLMPLPA